jgi:hypothetical protein
MAYELPSDASDLLKHPTAGTFEGRSVVIVSSDDQ